MTLDIRRNTADDRRSLTDISGDILPKHVAIIMDGNGRWAEECGLARAEGHRAGYLNVNKIAKVIDKAKIKYLTLFGFSTENWQRPLHEVSFIMGLVESADENVEELNRNNVVIRHVGRTDRLDKTVLKHINYAVSLTRNNTGLCLSFAFDYGGRDDIVHAARCLFGKVSSPDEISEELISENLFTSDLPDPDLLIRTGGEFRISNFLLWQAAYAELYYSSTLWPDFGEAEMNDALLAYVARRRRFGRVH